MARAGKTAKRVTNILTAVALVLPAGAWAESLGDALASAYKHSGLLDQQRALLRATDEGVAQAVAALRPTVAYKLSGGQKLVGIGEGQITGDWSNTLAFVASMDLYTFGRNALSVGVEKETVLATRASLMNYEQQVLSAAVSAYMDVREAQALVNLRDSAVRLNQQNLKASRDRFEVGEITRTQVSQYEAQLASARANLAAAQGTLSAAREAYKVAVGHYPSKLSSPPAIKLPAKSLDQAVQIARGSHPGIIALQHQVAAYDLAVEIAERNMLPTVTGELAQSYTDTLNQNKSVTSLNLGVSGPIYSGGKIASAVRQTMAQRDAGRSNLLQTSREVEQAVRTNWSLMSVYTSAANASDAYVQAQRIAYDGVKEEASLGASTTLEVLSAEQDLLDAQVSAIQARIDRETQSYAVMQSMGLLTAQKLGLNVPIYDPSAYYNAVKDAPVRHVSPQGEKLDRVLEGLMRD